MKVRIITTASLLLALLAASAPGQVAELSYEKADLQPSMYYGAPPLTGEGDGWTKGADGLSSRAKTYRFHNMDLSAEGGSGIMLITVDGAEKGAFDTLFLDLDQDRILDEGERFAITRMDGSPFAGTAVAYRAEKVPFPVRGGQGTFDVNLMLIPDYNPGRNEMMILGMTNWGYRKGTVTLGDKVYEVALIDHKVNGAFDDFQSDRPGQTDCLLFAPEGELNVEPGLLYQNPLLKRMLVDGTAYVVTVSMDGSEVELESFEVAFGEVTWPGEDVAVTFVHPEWGAQAGTAGQAMKLPAGTWKIQEIVRTHDEGIALHLRGPKRFEIEVEKNGRLTLELSTNLHAEVTPRKQGPKMVLSLALNTKEGASFSYYQGKGNDFLRGIPFTIHDASGVGIYSGDFTFG